MREKSGMPTTTFYLESAIADVAAGRPVATAETKAYGCSVEYGP